MALLTPDTAGLTVAPNAAGDVNNPAAVAQELKVHRSWGRYADVTQLPNHPANPASSPAYDFLRPGDVALVQTGAQPLDGDLHYLIDRGTLAGGDAVWARLKRNDEGNAVLFWGAENVQGTTTTRYLTFGFENGVAPTTAIHAPLPRDGTLRRLFVRHNNAAGNGNAIVYTLFVNGVATALSVSLATGAVAQTADLINSVSIVQGDRVVIEVTKAANVGSGNVDVVVTLEFV